MIEDVLQDFSVDNHAVADWQSTRASEEHVAFQADHIMFLSQLFDGNYTSLGYIVVEMAIPSLIQ